MTAEGAWSEVSPVFAEEVARYCLERSGSDSLTAADESTVRTNSELVPKRAATLEEWLRDLLGREPLANKRLLEAGCGFGALACYLALAHSASVTAVDLEERVLSVARAALAKAGCEDAVRLVEADMRDLSVLDDGSFDVAILNNSFIYVPAAEEQLGALRELHRVLAPGGTILLFQANKWRWREPFTHDPLVHLLPTWLADRTGWKHNHGRVRLLSPPELKRLLRKAGFRKPTIQVQPGRPGPLQRHLTQFYGVSAAR